MTHAEMRSPAVMMVGQAASLPSRISLDGAYVIVEPLDSAKHSDDLWTQLGGTRNAELWRYLRSGPFPERTSFDEYLRAKAGSRDPLYFAMVDRASGRAGGHAAYMRIKPSERVIEVGAIIYASAFQNTRGATEAMYLMARHVFEDLGYRRCEWKCNVFNEASQRAALRLGFAFEGVFRQHMIVKGQSSDTAWFAVLDKEWPERKREFERWLAPQNFDGAGRQTSRLTHI